MARRRKNALIHVEGADELNAALRSVGNRTTGLILRQAAEAGASVVRDAAKSLAPVDTGRLRDSIDVELHRLQGGRAQFNIAPGKDAWYGRLIELGSEKMAAIPFLRPALDATKDDAAEAVEEVLRDALKDVLD